MAARLRGSEARRHRPDPLCRRLPSHRMVLALLAFRRHGPSYLRPPLLSCSLLRNPHIWLLHRLGHAEAEQADQLDFIWCAICPDHRTLLVVQGDLFWYGGLQLAMEASEMV